MTRLMGSKVFARSVAQVAPAGYVYGPPASGFLPGRVLSGPYADWITTVCLLDGDDGAWFVEMVARAGGAMVEVQP